MDEKKILSADLYHRMMDLVSDYKDGNFTEKEIKEDCNACCDALGYHDADLEGS